MTLSGVWHSIAIAILLLTLPRLGLAQASSSVLQITAPANGTIVSPGQKVTVIVSSPTDLALKGVVVLGEPIGFSNVATSLPAHFSLTIPSRTSCRQYKLVAIGTTLSGQELSSNQVLIDVEPSGLPVSLSPLMPAVEFDNLGETFPVKISGNFSDGSVLDVTESSNLVYSSSNNDVVTVDNFGMLTARGVGAASVIANYGGKRRVSIPVTIPPQALAPSSSSLKFGNQPIGVSSSQRQVTLTNRTAAPMEISGVSTTGDFSEEDNCLSSSPIPAGGTCAVEVKFTPTVTGLRQGILSISQNFNGALGISLSGAGVALPK
jgi:hypothetical protein